ncbi:MAG: hypothetical protein ACD_40C00113G0003 [uncultured bacterium]|uniref:Uncharacterized protein n=1 Tax=Candidatus Collierbacteria bacterium RIFOXYD1_FULL_46_26 TaxID=1817732 RepID=A0A1F5FZF0_9BACT|nr:MAG: hypothetical protein ACD_40C00113G0003 [uncultured bacterium]KKU20699.1 MAG: hypothetical protein UX32_C0017G0006 [Microgenomates group bacterium GW2011_GWF1_46_12]OGD84991.1 MAG: hypothetical protein A2618_02625 [Candidatus Collierbacteria bacterium RIFOXYD1_FULL_46_26]
MADKIDLTERASESKKKIGRSVSVNGVHAVDVDFHQAQNLQDPIVDLNIKVNNPIGRLWLALKRIWKSQNTIVSVRFTIPLLVLPIALYVLWVLWQGRGVNIPMSKLGVIHEVNMNGTPRDILVLPTSDVYVLEYAGTFNRTTRLAEKPIIVVGNYHVPTNTLIVESLTPYSQLDLPITQTLPNPPKNVWENIWDFIKQFR